MKKIIYALTMLMLLSFVNMGSAKSLSEYDGTAWNGFTESTKLTYIMGFIAGSGYVVTETYFPPPKDFDRSKGFLLVGKVYKPDKKGEKSQNISFTKEEMILWGHHRSTTQNDALLPYNIAEITVGQIVSGLNILYKDFRNARIKISDAIYVVKKQIEGLSDEDTEKILLYLRGGKSNSDLLFIKDSEGKYVRWLSFP